MTWLAWHELKLGGTSGKAPHLKMKDPALFCKYKWYARDHDDFKNAQLCKTHCASPPQLNIQSLWQYQQLPNMTFHIPPWFGWHVLERELETLTLTVMRFKRRLKEVNWESRLQNGSIHSSVGMKQYEQNNQTPNAIYFGKQGMSNFSE